LKLIYWQRNCKIIFLSNNNVKTVLIEYISAGLPAYTSAHPHANKIYKLSKY
jgi:hypothetical protein